MTDAFDLKVHTLRLTCEAITAVHLSAHAGAQWRGALWDALRTFACTDPTQQGKVAHSWHCPMCFVLALEAESPRGVNPARPLVIRPPLAVRAEADSLFAPGDCFVLELVIIGEALSTLPYLLQAVQRIGQQGIGRGRGRFQLKAAAAHNSLTQATTALYASGSAVRMPDIPVTGEQVQHAASRLPSDRLWLHFLTPTQLVAEGKLLARPHPTTLIARILERLQSLERHYGEPAAQDLWKQRHEALGKAAALVHLRRDETRWIRAYSGSRRANRLQDVSGFVGSALLEGDVELLRQWLLWAALVNVGKNTIKGNGWLEVGA
jgi:hypothetical protein